MTQAPPLYKLSSLIGSFLVPLWCPLTNDEVQFISNPSPCCLCLLLYLIDSIYSQGQKDLPLYFLLRVLKALIFLKKNVDSFLYVVWGNQLYFFHVTTQWFQHHQKLSPFPTAWSWQPMGSQGNEGLCEGSSQLICLYGNTHIVSIFVAVSRAWDQKMWIVCCFSLPCLSWLGL